VNRHAKLSRTALERKAHQNLVAAESVLAQQRDATREATLGRFFGAANRPEGDSL
jgi:hypothetical protein